MQGMVTSIRDAGGAMLFRIDDSTGCIDAKMTHAVRKRSMNADECYNPGAYVLVTGKVHPYNCCITPPFKE